VAVPSVVGLAAFVRFIAEMAAHLRLEKALHLRPLWAA
jgi:hypothetical protein